MVRVLKRFLLFGVLPLLLLGGIVAWCERELILSCYYLHRLEHARGDEVAEWAEKTASLEERAVPRLLKMLREEDAFVCAASHAALTCLGERWGKSDPRSGEVVQQAVKDFSRLSPAGQEVVLKLTQDWSAAGSDCPECLVCAGSRLLAEVRHLNRPTLIAPGVELALTLVARSNQPDLLCAAREIARISFKSPDVSTRARGLRLAIRPGVELRKESVALLDDPEALVRRAAMLAIGEDAEAITTDNLMAWLHDADAEVRRLCEAALKGSKRGSLKPAYVRLAKLISDPRWEVRLTVLDHLAEAEGLDLGVWLRRLSHDDSAAVRAAAVRAACSCEAVDLTDRLDQMAQDDPSPTVSALARHYLRQRKN